MALRRKERPPTLEEIKEKLLEGTGESWLHSDPLCGFTPLIDNGRILPLTAKIENSVVVLFFLDPADFVTERSLEILGHWIERYRKLHWTPILAFRAKYLFLKNPRFFEAFRQFSFFPTLPIFIDEQNSWFNFVKAEGPTLAFLQNGNIVFSTALLPDFANHLTAAEEKLQECLRTTNPGLPLLEVAQTVITKTVDQQTVVANDIGHAGYWTNSGNSITSDDPNAKLTIPFSGKHLRLIAIGHPQARESTKAQVFLDEIPLPAILRGAQVHAGDRGHSVFEINKHTGIYEIVRADALIKGTISVKFLNTLENPVVIYELRIA